MDGPSESEVEVKVDGLEGSGRSNWVKVDGPKRHKVDGPQKMKLNGPKNKVDGPEKCVCIKKYESGRSKIAWTVKKR